MIREQKRTGGSSKLLTLLVKILIRQGHPLNHW